MANSEIVNKYLRTKALFLDEFEIEDGGVIEEPHQHVKHYLMMSVSGLDPIEAKVKHVNIYFCPRCYLCWFEELAPTSPLLQGLPKRS